MSKITLLSLKAFTAFSDFYQVFSPGINILIGPNSTGKTHILKTLYTACAITIGEDSEKGFATKLKNIFNPHDSQISRLSRKPFNDNIVTQIDIIRDNTLKLGFLIDKYQNLGHLFVDEWQKKPLDSAYIPVKEILAHAPGFVATTSKRELAFEDIYPDIIKRAFLPKLKEIPVGYANLVSSLQKSIGGKVTQKGEYFFIENEHGELEFTLLAEGLRKLALLVLLIQNGTLQPGSILFWDEPEANLNPALMGQVVEVILELQRLGVQVFLATHNYVLLKEFDLRKKPEDAIRYISLFRDDSGAVAAQATDTYSLIQPNPISDTFADLFQRDMARALKVGDD
jgi:predicted ATPase